MILLYLNLLYLKRQYTEECEFGIPNKSHFFSSWDIKMN